MIKQVIVMRTDLGMRKGKMVAQGAHACVFSVVMMMVALYMQSGGEMSEEEVRKNPTFQWFNDGHSTKICLRVGSEAELMEIHEKAQAASLPVYLVVDNGLTEFHGVKTKTCLAIGPAEAEDVDKITGHLELL